MSLVLAKSAKGCGHSTLVGRDVLAGNFPRPVGSAPYSAGFGISPGRLIALAQTGMSGGEELRLTSREYEKNTA
jgi:hypothetical protein